MNHLAVVPGGARALLVLAHGAGAGMRHPFMERFAAAIAVHGVATLRYEFGYMEQGSRRPDPPAVAAARVREAVAAAEGVAPGLPRFAGGKSFGGRMTSTAQAQEPLAGVRGLVFLGFPLHPPDKPGTSRADHLAGVAVPMLFLQGTRDDFARLDLLEPVVDGLRPRATLRLVEGADHSFAVRKAAGRGPGEVMEELAGAAAEWMLAR